MTLPLRVESAPLFWNCSDCKREGRLMYRLNAHPEDELVVSKWSHSRVSPGCHSSTSGQSVTCTRERPDQ